MTTRTEEKVEEKVEITIPEEETKQEFNLSPPAMVSFSGLNSLRESMLQIDEEHMVKDNTPVD